MKSAKETVVTCSLFRQLIMDYVDDELDGKVRSDFSSHADVCPDCRRELQEIQRVRRLLAGLPPATVSSEFDFRLKAGLRLEDSRLRSPVYRFKLYLRDNLRPIVTVPAAAVLLVSGVFYSQDFFRDGVPGSHVVEQTLPSEPPKATPVADADLRAEEVNYVLESLDSDSVGVEVTSSGQTGTRNAEEPALKTVSLINF